MKKINENTIEKNPENLTGQEIRLGNHLINPGIIQMIPEKLMRQHKIIPLRKEGDRLYVAMADPDDLLVLDDISLASGCMIAPVAEHQRDIDMILDRIFGFQDFVTKAVKKYEVMPTPPSNIYNLDEVPDHLNEETSTIGIVNSLISKAVKEKVSDIHIEPQEAGILIRYRIDGILKNILSLPKQSLAPIISRIKIMGDMDIAERRIPLDGRVQIKIFGRKVDLRISTIPTIYGEKAVIRILDQNSAMIKLNALGMPESLLSDYRQFIRSSYGMILITGPTGSGKTTTLYATLSEIITPEKNIITIEDPVEYVIPGINQIRVNNKAGLGFARGLRSILRQDPDIVMVGEIRDKETAEIAVRAASTGHLVFSTLHTNDAAGALPRLIDMAVEPFLVASSVIAVIAQRLVRTICRECREEYLLADNSLERRFLGIPDGIPVMLSRGRGCRYCSNTGYRGRVSLQELLPVTKELQELIMNKAYANEIKKTALSQGMVSLMQDGIHKVLAGVTSLDEVMRVAHFDERR